MPRDTIPSQFSSTRRHVLLGGSAVALAAFAQWPGSASAAELDPENFLALSKQLTRHDDLSSDIATAMLEAFKATGKADELSALADGADNQELANAVVAAWYSGVSPDPDSGEVLTYTDALMWQAMSFTKPMGYCGGEMGYWAEPPAG
ncbi:sugar dehydrogenase complex small subunit [Hoeflea alexandrii]|uniref:sugar dehydrogenase complex small subunit n=1 Tax=Hoeflea alexandrii TaxID=288436 RepID=UPI0022AE5763|nr:sugar dehydrogenase complex small subunit [Hoeflea alexandrii]MCZ4291866.1 sugar dehydrogenase complex small subunit [Hoeflea alexandrii]